MLEEKNKIKKKTPMKKQLKMIKIFLKNFTKTLWEITMMLFTKFNIIFIETNNISNSQIITGKVKKNLGTRINWIRLIFLINILKNFLIRNINPNRIWLEEKRKKRYGNKRIELFENKNKLILNKIKIK